MSPERQVLYGLVSAGFAVVVLVLLVAASSVVPGWWTVFMSIALTVAVGLGASDWRRTTRLLTVSVGLFLLWLVGTLLVLR